MIQIHRQVLEPWRKTSNIEPVFEQSIYLTSRDCSFNQCAKLTTPPTINTEFLDKTNYRKMYYTSLCYKKEY